MKKSVALWLIIMGTLFSCNLSEKQVSENEYFIQGELTHVADGAVIELYEEDAGIFKCVSRDTLVNGIFSFRDTVTELRKVELAGDRGFPGSRLDIWIAPGKYIQVSGEDKLITTWNVTSDIPEQEEENRYKACALKERKELMKLEVVEYDLLRAIFLDHPGDENFVKITWPAIDSVRKLQAPLEKVIREKELEYMQNAPLSKVWINNLLFYTSMLRNKDIFPYQKELEAIYARMPECEKQTVIGKEIASYLFPAPKVEIGDEMADGDLYDKEGNLRRLSEFKGRYILLDFWSSGCVPCLHSFPEMEEITANYAGKMAVVSISEDPEARWKKFIDEKKLEGNQWNELRTGRTGLASRYQVTAIPHYVLIDPAGKVVDMWAGYGKGSLIKKMKKHLDK